jgi:hypothetical protein
MAILTVCMSNGVYANQTCVSHVSKNLHNLMYDLESLLVLAKKCENVTYQWPENGTAKSTLQKLGLVQQNGTFDGEVKKVLDCTIACSREQGSLKVILRNPMTGSVEASLRSSQTA